MNAHKVPEPTWTDQRIFAALTAEDRKAAEEFASTKASKFTFGWHLCREAYIQGVAVERAKK